MDPVAAAGSVVAAHGGAQVPVLNGQGDQSAGAAGDMPGQGAPEARGSQRAVATEVVRCRREEQPFGGDPFQDPDGGRDRGDRDPRDFPEQALGQGSRCDQRADLAAEDAHEPG